MSHPTITPTILSEWGPAHNRPEVREALASRDEDDLIPEDN